MENDQYIKKWLRVIAPHKHESYLRNLKEFCSLHGKTPKELIDEYYADDQKEPIEQENIAENRVWDYFDYLQGKKVNGKIRKRKIKKGSAITYAFGNIGGFYAQCYRKIDYKKKMPQHENKLSSKQWLRNEKVIPIDDYKPTLREIFSNLSNTRDKAFFESMLSSALYPADLVKNSVKDYRDFLGLANSHNLEIAIVLGKRKKTEIAYCTFFSKEAIQWIETYLKEREMRKEKVNDDSWLFVSEKPYEIAYKCECQHITTLKTKRKNGNYRKCENCQKDLSDSDIIERKFKRMYKTRFSYAISEVCEKLGIEGFTPKSLRDYFETKIEGKIIHSHFNALVGYKGNTEVLQYKIGFILELAKDYIENVESVVSLDMEKELRQQLTNTIEKQDEKIEKQDERIKNLENTIKELKEQNAKIEMFFRNPNLILEQGVKLNQTIGAQDIKEKSS